jgi:hypothetical protein
MNDHVAKPVDPQQLFRTVLRWLLAGRTGAADTSAAQSSSHVSTAHLTELSMSFSFDQPTARTAGASPHGPGSVCPQRDAPDRQQLTDALDQLDSLFRRADFDALTVWRRHAPHLQTDDTALLITLEAQLRGYDYEAALATLGALRERLLMPS